MNNELQNLIQKYCTKVRDLHQAIDTNTCENDLVKIRRVETSYYNAALKYSRELNIGIETFLKACRDIQEDINKF